MWGLATALLLAGAGSALAQNNTGNLNGNYNTFSDNNGNLNGGNSQARERRARSRRRRSLDAPPLSDSVLRVGQVTSGSNNYVSAQAVSPPGPSLQTHLPLALAACAVCAHTHKHRLTRTARRARAWWAGPRSQTPLATLWSPPTTSATATATSTQTPPPTAT
jgi:hypothetical protein